MFVTTQPWQNDGDYRKLIQNLEPPPPPGNDNGWELHFCKWWGWNWVRKKEVVVAEAPTQKPGALKSVEENKPEKMPEKKPEKKPVKHLCQSLCFRKKKNQKPLQDKYNTPSNSAIENDNENKRKPIANSLTEGEDKKIEERIKLKRRRSKEWTSSTDKCCCGCRCRDRDRDRSSTEESVECINITCCSCCNPRERPPTKNTIEKYTQEVPPQCTMRATQTEQTQKKSRRKHICVVCCCRCNQNNQPLCCTCCSCGNIRSVDEKLEKQRETYLDHGRAYTDKSVEAEPDFDKSRTTLHRKECKNCFPVYRTSADQPNIEKPIKKPTPKHPGHLKRRFEPLYMTGMPIDTMLYHNKPITKFGIPSRSYSWIHATKSDILDQFPHSRINHEPLNISPTKLQDLESEPSALFSPLSVDKEIETLKQIESDVKMDLKSRIMLDAICDAIMSKDKEPEISSSIFLNEFTYPSNVTQTECIIKDIYKSEQKNTCSKLNQTGLEGIIFEDVTNNSPYKNKVSCETNTSSLHLSVGNQENNSIQDYINVRSPQIYAMDNLQRRSLHNPYVPLNYSTHHEHLIPNENKYPQLIDYTIENNYPLIPTRRPQTFTRNRLVPTIKRAASPSPRGRDIKKVKLGEPPALPSFNSSHVSDIFKKVDEIILRSKVNNEEIQTVLNTIPKSTYKLFTSWEVSNLINQNQLLHNLNHAENSNSYIASTSEGKKEKIEKAKAPQLKKKKVCSRPSLIPKRVTNSKLNKKNTTG